MSTGGLTIFIANEGVFLAVFVKESEKNKRIVLSVFQKILFSVPHPLNCRELTSFINAGFDHCQLKGQENISLI